MVTIRWRARFHPGQQTRWSASLHLRTAPSDPRSVCRAPACWRCRRALPCPEPYRPTPAFLQTTGFSGDTTALLWETRAPSQGRPQLRPRLLKAGAPDGVGASHPAGRNGRFGSASSAAPCLWGPRLHPGSVGGWTRTRSLGLTTAKVRLEGALPPAAAEVAGGRQKTETRPCVGRCPSERVPLTF